MLDRFLDPLIFGDYPKSMKSRVGSRLPKFSKSQTSLVKGSLDFVGINHYTTFYAMHNGSDLLQVALHDYISDSAALTLRKLYFNLFIFYFYIYLLFWFSWLFIICLMITPNWKLLFVFFTPSSFQWDRDYWRKGKFFKNDDIYIREIFG